MSRIKIVAEKNGFRVTWYQESIGEKGHRWWHWFYTTEKRSKENGSIKGKTYTKKRVWRRNCTKCLFASVRVRELWMPGEKIPNGINYFKPIIYI